MLEHCCDVLPDVRRHACSLAHLLIAANTVRLMALRTYPSSRLKPPGSTREHYSMLMPRLDCSCKS